MMQLEHPHHGMDCIIAQLLMTLCKDGRVDFSVYSQRQKQCNLIIDNSIKRQFIRRPEHALDKALVGMVISARNYFLDISGYYYDPDRLMVKDIHEPKHLAVVAAVAHNSKSVFSKRAMEDVANQIPAKDIVYRKGLETPATIASRCDQWTLIYGSTANLVFLSVFFKRCDPGEPSDNTASRHYPVEALRCYSVNTY